MAFVKLIARVKVDNMNKIRINSIGQIIFHGGISATATFAEISIDTDKKLIALNFKTKNEGGCFGIRSYSGGFRYINISSSLRLYSVPVGKCCSNYKINEKTRDYIFSYEGLYSSDKEAAIKKAKL